MVAYCSVSRSRLAAPKCLARFASCVLFAWGGLRDMRLGILTQPLHTNYGGLLQAFALQKYLRDELEHDVLTVDYTRKPKAWLAPYRVARRCVAKFLKRRKIALFPTPISQGVGKFTQRFIDENIRTTKKIFAPARELDFAEYGFEAFFVGSDQTWRPAYSPYMPTFFFDFLGEDKKTRRIAYASSFGKDEWEFSPEMTKICAPLAKKFHAISVREDSGISLCEKYLGVNAEHVIDPPMLLSQEDYCAVVERDEARGFLEKRVPAKRLFAYVLDEAPEKKVLIASVAESLGLELDEIMPKREELASGAKAYLPVSAWLRGFRDAGFVVTDSFHGCVFSIIFNKNFIAIGNALRGMSRFHSLLKMFGLGNRLLILDENLNVRDRIPELLSENIDWEKINAIRSHEQARARQFLGNALKR